MNFADKLFITPMKAQRCMMLKLKRALLSMKPTNISDYPDQYSTKVNALRYL